MVKRVSPEVAAEIDRSLGLSMISIRLPTAMIEDYKLVAELKGQLYQPLMREAMALWIDEAKTNILKGLAFDERERQAKRAENSVPAQSSVKP